MEDCGWRIVDRDFKIDLEWYYLKICEFFLGKNYSSEPITFKLISFLINRRLGYQAAKSPMMVTEANT